MSVENQVLVDELNQNVFNKKYDIKHNTTTTKNVMNSTNTSDINLIDTIENISEGMVTNNNTSSCGSSQHGDGAPHNKNKRNIKNKTVTEKNLLKNRKFKTKEETQYNKEDPINDARETNQNIYNKRNKEEQNKSKNEKNPKKKNIFHSSYAHISQIYETDDTILKEKEEDIEQTKEIYSPAEENSILSLLYAIIFIIFGIIIIIHMYLDRDHILIKGFVTFTSCLLNTLKNVPFGRGFMKIVTSTHLGINKILDELVTKYNITEEYVDTFRKLNTEFFVLSIFIILSLIVLSLFINIVCNIVDVKQKKIKDYKKINIEREEIKPKPVLVMNKMTVEEFDDRTFTYNEIKKLHEDEEYICLKNKRAGDGVEAWNWQSRVTNAEEKNIFSPKDKDICSDIDLSALSSSEQEQVEEKEGSREEGEDEEE